MKLNNTYYLLRHGEALSNAKEFMSSWPELRRNPLTDHGKKTIRQAAKILKENRIDLIFSSDLLRAKQTAGIVAKALKITPKFDRRLRELDFGIFNGKPKGDFDSYFTKETERLGKSVPNGETYRDVAKRVWDFLRSTDKKYQGKHIVIVSHECPLLILMAKARKISLLHILQKTSYQEKFSNGIVRKFR